MPNRLGPILPAEECRRRLDSMTSWNGAATYLLYNRRTNEPIYCGTAKNRSSVRRHLAKDDLANGPVGKTQVNPELRNYCLAQRAGWLGVAFHMFGTLEEAKLEERRIIAQLGIRSLGGALYNQRLSG